MPTTTTDYKVTFFHADHGLSEGHKAFAVEQMCGASGFVLVTVDLPERLGDVQNALYGPKAGDAPVKGSYYSKRDGREFADVMVDMPTRPSRKLSVIGVTDNDAATITIFTAHGGPVAEKNMQEVMRDFGNDEATKEDVDRTAKFWSEHALAAQ